MRRAKILALVLVLMAAGNRAEDSFQSPQIAGYGGVASIPQAAEPPRRGAKVVFDITADSQPDQVNRGLESVARYLNLGAQAGLRPQDVQLALVLHGGATRCALDDEAYSRVTKAERNPNRKLLAELKTHGVQLYVCGQSLARNKYAQGEVAPEMTVAASAMTVNVNKQLDGYAYLAIH